MESTKGCLFWLPQSHYRVTQVLINLSILDVGWAFCLKLWNSGKTEWQCEWCYGHGQSSCWEHSNFRNSLDSIQNIYKRQSESTNGAVGMDMGHVVDIECLVLDTIQNILAVSKGTCDLDYFV